MTSYCPPPPPLHFDADLNSPVVRCPIPLKDFSPVLLMVGFCFSLYHPGFFFLQKRKASPRTISQTTSGPAPGSPIALSPCAYPLSSLPSLFADGLLPSFSSPTVFLIVYSTQAKCLDTLPPLPVGSHQTWSFTSQFRFLSISHPFCRFVCFFFSV